MKMFEARDAVRPFITAKRAAEWAMLDSDWSLWVEYNIIDPADINVSVTTDFGLRLSDWIEEELEALLINRADEARIAAEDRLAYHVANDTLDLY